MKKENRIEASSMLMVLCLFVYAAAEWFLRSKLKESGSTVKKPVEETGSEFNHEMDLYHFYETG